MLQKKTCTAKESCSDNWVPPFPLRDFHTVPMHWSRERERERIPYKLEYDIFFCRGGKWIHGERSACRHLDCRDEGGAENVWKGVTASDWWAQTRSLKSEKSPFKSTHWCLTHGISAGTESRITSAQSSHFICEHLCLASPLFGFYPLVLGGTFPSVHHWLLIYRCCQAVVELEHCSCHWNNNQPRLIHMSVWERCRQRKNPDCLIQI